MKESKMAVMGKSPKPYNPHEKIEAGGHGESQKPGYPHEKGSKTKKKGFAEKANPH